MTMSQTFQVPKGTLAIIGGSGLSQLNGLKKTRLIEVNSPFGQPSHAFLFGELEGAPVLFLPRHGAGHAIPPSEINYRANIDALKRVGITQILSVSAVGSLRENLHPGMFVIVDQFIDQTFARQKSFFTTGLVAHVSMAHPVCARLGQVVEASGVSAGIDIVQGGTYLTMEGPQFSTLAESYLYRNWGCDVIGMTNMPEAKLAREAEMCYASVAMVTDYDCWHTDHEHVTTDMIIKVLHENADKARALITDLVPRLATKPVDLCPEGCHRALENALVTAPEMRDPALVKKLDAILKRF